VTPRPTRLLLCSRPGAEPGCGRTIAAERLAGAQGDTCGPVLLPATDSWKIVYNASRSIYREVKA